MSSKSKLIDKSQTGISAVILAAGYGKRLRPFTNSIPKPMLPIGRHPFLAYLVAYFLRNGVDEVIIYAGYRVEIIRSYFENGPWRYAVKVISDDPLAGTGRGLIRGATMANGSEILVCGGDLIVEFDVADLVAKHRAGQLQCTFVVSKKSPQNEGAFHVDEKDRLVFSEEIRGADELRRIQNANLPAAVARTSSTGTALFKKDYLAGMDPRLGLSLEQELLPTLICKQQILVFDIGTRFFHEFGVPERYEHIRNRADIIERIYGNPL